ncbi:YgaP family membrane protein [Labilibaculum euxinus]
MRERIIRGIAGTLVLVSILLALFYVNMNWLLLTAFVGLNLLQSSITKWCLMDDILKKVFKMDN